MFLSMMRMVCDSTFILDQKSRHGTKIDEIMAIVFNILSEGDGKVVISELSPHLYPFRGYR